MPTLWDTLSSSLTFSHLPRVSVKIRNRAGGQLGGEGITRIHLTSRSSEPTPCQLVAKAGLVLHLWFFHLPPRPTVWTQEASKWQGYAEHHGPALPDRHCVHMTWPLVLDQNWLGGKTEGLWWE